MAERYDRNPYNDEQDVNPFADPGVRSNAVKSSYGGGPFYMTNDGGVPPASNLGLSPLPPEPADFRTTIDIPLNTEK